MFLSEAILCPRPAFGKREESLPTMLLDESFAGTVGNFFSKTAVAGVEPRKKKIKAKRFSQFCERRFRFMQTSSVSKPISMYRYKRGLVDALMECVGDDIRVPCLCICRFKGPVRGRSIRWTRYCRLRYYAKLPCISAISRRYRDSIIGSNEAVAGVQQ